jgi:hypothetical protein
MEILGDVGYYALWGGIVVFNLCLIFGAGKAIQAVWHLVLRLLD